MSFGDKLKKYRKNHSLTQLQLAEQCGFSRSTITELERETRKVTLKTIEKVAKGTNTHTSDWIETTNNIKINQFDGLILVIDALVKADEIDSYGNVSEFGLQMLNKMLLKEVKLYMENKNNAITYDYDLTTMPNYAMKDSIIDFRVKENEPENKSHLIPIAAHDKSGIFTDEQYKHDNDIMDNDDLWK
ncbi:MAG: helix-turn-helix transcriptional regulator [Clostridium sp.]|uniref:helix-turn-helix domain-containing protein n=1 Tax=Clostridium sp. TaxID=1506 RepID=UPI0030723E84